MNNRENQAKKNAIEEQLAKISLLKAEIELNKTQIKSFEDNILYLREQSEELQWIEISWEELQNYVLLGGNITEKYKNPVVKSLTFKDKVSYCYFKENGDFIVGGHYHADGFDRGQPLLVKYNYQNYKDYNSSRK